MDRDIDTPAFQPELEGMPEHPKHRDQYAFGGFIKTELYDIFGELPIAELTDEEKAWFSPRRLHEICMVDRSDEEAYRESERFGGVLLSPVERVKLVYSASRLGNRALDGVLASKTEINEEVVDASRRGHTHAIESKVQAMKSTTESMVGRRADIMELMGEARTPGAAHKRKERMHQLFSASWQEMLNLADTLQAKKGYTDEKKQRFLTAAVNFLTTGPQSERVANWKQLLLFQKQYLDARIRVFERQIKRAEKEISPEEV